MTLIRVTLNDNGQVKKCSKCGVVKALEDFPRSSKRADGRNTYCKTCKKDYNGSYYERTKQVHNPSRFARNRQARLDATEYVIAYLREHPCADCGETDIVVLDFDHQRDKRMDINSLIKDGYPIATIAAEIEKCEVVCANDHRRRTAKTQSWRRASVQITCAGSSAARAGDS